MGKTFYFCDGRKEGCPRTNCWHITRNSELCHYSNRLRDSLTLKATGHVPTSYFQLGDDSFEYLCEKSPEDFLAMRIKQKASRAFNLPHIEGHQYSSGANNAERDSYDNIMDPNGWYEFW